MARDRVQGDTDPTAIGLLQDAPRYVWGWHAWHTRQPFENHHNVVHVLGITKGGDLIGSVVYSALRHSNIEIHIHTIDKYWCNRRTLRAIFEYPFVELGLNRVTATTDPAIPAVCNFLNRIGFVEEGRLRRCKPDGGDILILGMTRQECRWR